MTKIDTSAYRKPARNASAPATAFCRTCKTLFSSDDIIRNAIARLSIVLTHGQESNHSESWIPLSENSLDWDKLTESMPLYREFRIAQATVIQMKTRNFIYCALFNWQFGVKHTIGGNPIHASSQARALSEGAVVTDSHGSPYQAQCYRSRMISQQLLLCH